MKLLHVSVLFMALIILVSCSKTYTGTLTERCVAQYNDAETKFKDGKYWKVKEDLEEILKSCTGTGVMEGTNFMLAESHFRLEEWIEARAQYGSFVNFFPGSPYAETAAYRRAVSAYNLSYKDSRDQTNTTLAIRDFGRFEAEYPNSALMDSAYMYLDSLSNRVAENDYQIARLYSRMNEPSATAIYLKEFLDEFPKSPRQKEAIVMLINSYIDMKEFASAKFYLERLRDTYSTDEKMLASGKRLEERITDAEKSLERVLERERKQKLRRKDDDS
ncbi:MAG: outer membrane protein assembly factor BamD [Fibromonadaceae bacterium]|jgi:outer membrane protein assembly factor BamD|nr:outer membrane protein assembly factor BamD [Fibromonadaceae bacterium]